ncbi:Nuclear nucleic acid-binding protein C1D-like Protein [Tribolium castaneum]|uniref:Nuclear nucleic acid-binding protein C1D n=1 Tax=Tribolium castaneum TaxID=7070 RepID=D6WVJ5_TRICA|nr:PREDICTED: nuclear nucleic acid-binding protein C1D [Tribolium castaneum]EFA08579.1 Nuclear nucleic acid-binding protein C1D-like Protein [Tribolium castaneum]|eukprot:XP_972343.1 PREDICTED: nuclear nucleic acid-binding protein C1D [Tribolium castaneum]
MDFGDLSEDKAIQTKLSNFHSSVEKIEKIIEISSSPDIYDKLTTKEKVDYDLFMAYTLNTLFWLYLKTKGEDPTKSEIKNQLNRVKQYMVKAKEAHERQVLRPRIDCGAAGRFIKHGINYKDSGTPEEPPNKKMKFSDD